MNPRTAFLFSLSVGVAATGALMSCGGGATEGTASTAAPAPGPAAPPSGSPSPAPSPSPTPAPAPAPSPSPSPAPPPAAPFAIDVSAPTNAVVSGVVPRATTFASGLATPWAMTFLPDGRLLVTQKGGSVVIVSADGKSISAPLAGIPAVDSQGQGGLLDVALDPQFASNRRVYLTFSEPANGLNGTAVARGTLNATDTGLDNVEIIFRQAPKKSGTSNHYGSRLVFRPDGTLFVTLGERQAYPVEAQSLASQLGKVVRIRPDGTVPPDNPFAAQGATAATVWTYGHRNPQAAALHPTTGDLWVTEHGPQGGDEVNLALPGRNFGWPNVSYGCNYGDPVGVACRIGGGTHNAPYTAPLAYWVPTSTAPGAMLFYTGSRFPEWQGSLFVGGLVGATLWRFVLNGNAIVGQERFFAGQHEIRDLKQGPDGWIYMISRNTNQILRIER